MENHNTHAIGSGRIALTPELCGIRPYYQDDAVTIYHGDCKQIVPLLGKFDLVLTDPPYGKVKGRFDHEWTNRPAMLEDCKVWRDMIYGAMKPNATLYWFAWPSLAGRIEATIADRLNPLSHIVWKKPSSVAQKASPEALRAPMPETERIIMAEHYGADNMEYLWSEWQRAGLTKKDAELATGTQMASHWFSSSQWALPTAENYAKLQQRANAKPGEFLRKDYEGLRKDYEFLRKDYEGLRRYFAMEKGDQKTEVWNFNSESENLGHPTPKPLDLISYIVRLSCRRGGTILDPFAGSGTTGRAAKDMGRKAVLIEREERYCEIAAKRMAQEVLPLHADEGAESCKEGLLK